MEIQTFNKRVREEEKFTSNKKSKIEQHDFSLLPEELSIQIFSHLSLGDLCNIPLVCKDWKRISEDDYLWSLNFSKLFGSPINQSCDLRAKSQFEKAFKELDSAYPKWIKEALGGAPGMVNLSVFNVDSKNDNILAEQNKQQLVNLSPITHIINSSGPSGLFIRSSDKENNKSFYLCIFDEPCNIHDLKGFGRFFAQKANKKYNSTPFLENYFTRLIQGRECGSLQHSQEKGHEEFDLGSVHLDNKPKI